MHIDAKVTAWERTGKNQMEISLRIEELTPVLDYQDDNFFMRS